MSEIPQAERTAIAQSVRNAGYPDGCSQAAAMRKGWLARSDYGRGREDEHRRGAAALEDRLEKAEEHVRALREALRYYSTKNWDSGKRAYAALTVSQSEVTEARERALEDVRGMPGPKHPCLCCGKRVWFGKVCVKCKWELWKMKA